MVSSCFRGLPRFKSTFIGLFGVLLVLPAWAGLEQAAESPKLSPAAFFKRIDLKAGANQELDSLLIKKQARITIQVVIEELKKDLKIFQAAARAGETRAWLDAEASEWPEAHLDAIEKAFGALESFDADREFADARVVGVFDFFDRELQKVLDHFRTLSKPEDHSYFYKKALLKKAVDAALDMAKKTLGNLPILNVVTFVIDRASTMIEQRRNFYQNMTLHYLQSFYAKEVGMESSDVVSKVRSSIYESRIPWFAVWEHNKAKQQWMYYGDDHFKAEATLAMLILQLNKKRYEEVGDRLNYAFQVVTEKGVRKIVNLVDRKSSLSIKPSDAYFFDQPGKVEKQRRMIRLAQMGLRIVSLPAWITNAADGFLDSMYVNQVQTEGALFGYMESAGMSAVLGTIAAQSVNPLMQLQ